MGVWYKGKRIDGQRGPAGSDGNPIGTIISYMGLTAPQDYLVCDGSVYNIADYSDLAKFFETQFGTSNHFGGDGTTTFAVPDLRGEFIRGTGTATRNTGSGGNVGEHQDPTQMPSFIVENDKLHYYRGDYDDMVDVAAQNRWLININGDKSWYETQMEELTFSNGIPQSLQSPAASHFSARPTNTSVLYCIKSVTSNATADSLILQSIYITTPPDKISYNPGDMFNPSGMVITARYNGGFFKQITSYTITPDGLLTIGTDTITISYTENGITATVDQPIRVHHIYGAIWDGITATKWTRTDGAAMFTDPVPYVAGATNYGSPFDDIMPWSGMVREERTGGTMVKIPKFWYQLYQNTEGNPSFGMTIRISDEPLEGFSVSPAHMDRGDGKGERDAVYIGRYHCAASDYKSKTGEKPKDNIIRSTARTEIHKLGTTIWQSDFAMRFTIWLLYLVEFADWGSQEKIGYGCGNGTSTKNMGYTDTMPYHTGTMQSGRDTYGLGTQYRYIEGLWDNVYDWCDGCYNDSSGLNIILNPNSFSDTNGGISIGTPCGDFPSEFTVFSEVGFAMFFGSKGGGSETTCSCDYWGFNASNPSVIVGGYYRKSNGVGLFYLHQYSESHSSDSIGSRIQELP